MKKSFHLSAFEDQLFIIVLLVVILMYIRNLIFLIFACVYIYKRYSSKGIIYFGTIIIIVILRLLISCIDLNHYYVYRVNQSSIELTNILNNIRIGYSENIETGDIVLIDGNRYINESRELKSNNRYYSYSNYEIKKIVHIPNPKNLLYKAALNNDNQYSKTVIDNLLFKTYDNSLLDISLSLLFIYKLLDKLLSKIRYHQFIVYTMIISIFGLSYSLFRIIIYEIIYQLTESKKSSLSFTCFLLILLNPYSIYSYKFIIPMLIRMIYIFRYNDSFYNNLLIIQSFFFNEIKPIQLLLYKPYTLLLYCLLFVSILSLWINPLNILVYYLYHCLSLLNNIINAAIRGHINIFVIVIYCFFKRCYKNEYIRALFLLIVIITNISNITGSITFIDVGQGDAILIRAPFNQCNILIDTGNSYAYYKLDRALKTYGIYELDALFITHDDKDHSGNLDNLYKDYRIKKVIKTHTDYDNGYFNLLSLNNANHDNDNDNSLVYLLTYDNYSFLLTGDISKDIEKEIIRNNQIEADVIKISHHGSKTGTSLELLRNLKPDIAIISTSGMYNHPHKEVIDLLNRFNIDIYNTKERGNIAFYFTDIIDFIKCSAGEFVIIR